MNFAKLRFNDIANGEGIRTTLFVQGCSIICPGCQNYSIQSYGGGFEFTIKQMDEILESMHDGISGLSILGGEPMSPTNIDLVCDIMQIFKEKFPSKTIWVWTGYELDLSLENEYIGEVFEDKPRFNNKRAMEYIDVLVDGRWEHQNYNPQLLWAGSTNQRVIDIKETIAANSIVLHSENL